MRKLFLLFGILTPLAAFGLFYKDSFSSKTTLSSSGTRSGVVFHDLFRATPGYHLVDHYLHDMRCSFAENPESKNFTLPGSFCTVLESGAFLGYSSTQLTLWKPDGLLDWKKNIHVHHDVSVDENAGTVFVVSGDFSQRAGEKPSTRYDSVRGYNFSGKEIFYWSLKDHKSDFEKMVGRAVPRRFNDPYFQFTHFNSVQELPKNPISETIPAFRAGNLLLNDHHYRVIFIIDRITKKIVWSYYPQGGVNAHSVRLNDAGQIVFFSNEKPEIGSKQPPFSSIDILDVPSKKIVHSITLTPKESFHSPFWGSLQPLPGNRFLVTNSLGGSAFEVDMNGRIFWEWVNPQSDSEGILPIYRVQLVPKARMEKMLSAWKLF